MENATSERVNGLSNATRIPLGFSIEFRIVATLLHLVIFTIGFVGNIAVVLVVKRTKSMHTPTNCYLVSLAIADLIVLVSAMPEQIVSHHLYAEEWIFGHFGCSVSIFMTFLGINASSTRSGFVFYVTYISFQLQQIFSILCFTVERYIGICHPLLAQKVCSVDRAKRIILGTWTFAVIYCCPWLGLTTTRISEFDEGFPKQEKCTYRLNRQHYVYFFITDLVLFYLLPLMVSIVLYARMGVILQNSARNSLGKMNRVRVIRDKPSSSGDVKCVRVRLPRSRNVFSHSHDQARIQVVRMLVIIVISFALLWLPYRGLLVYNSFAVPWRNIWYLLFAKTLIYISSAMNPVLYNAISKRFREEFIRVVFCLNKPEPTKLSTITENIGVAVPSTKRENLVSRLLMLTGLRRIRQSKLELLLGLRSSAVTPCPSAQVLAKVGRRLRNQELFRNAVDPSDNYLSRDHFGLNGDHTFDEL